MVGTIDYASAGPLTGISTVHQQALEGLPYQAVEICRLVHDLVIQPPDAKGLGVADHRFAENQLRRADDLVGALLALDPAPLTVARSPDRRVIGTCRHFAVLSCALLRYRHVGARVRCGFATYFQPGLSLDHWITEYRLDGRWVRIDSEILGGSLVANPKTLPLASSSAAGRRGWPFRRAVSMPHSAACTAPKTGGPPRSGENAVKDLAALNKVEMLPWDEWGRMTASYGGATGPDYDELIDTIAAVCARDDPVGVAHLYASEDLAVPVALLR